MSFQVNGPLRIEDERLDVAVRAALAGGQICQSYFNDKLTFESKDVSNLVTQADIESERKIVELIKQAFPDHAILAEENEKADLESPHLWIVDPLDGTNNFAHQVPHFAVSIAYWKDGQPECGVIFNPVRAELYYAQRTQGAYSYSQHATDTRLQTSSAKKMSDSLIGCGFYYDRGEMMRSTLRAVEACFVKNIHGIRRFGTASLDLIQVAAGRFGGYFEYRLAPWDFAAGRLMVEEAGGQITTCKGDVLSLDQSTILASNGVIHDELLEIVRHHHP